MELAWGSQSIRRVGRPSRARAAARLMAVVVLPTPPFWLTTAMTLDDWGRFGARACGLLAGWMVIIGVRRRVSGGRFGGNAGGPVQKWREAVENLWNARFAAVFGGFWRLAVWKSFVPRGTSRWSARTVNNDEIVGPRRRGFQECSIELDRRIGHENLIPRLGTEMFLLGFLRVGGAFNGAPHEEVRV